MDTPSRAFTLPLYAAGALLAGLLLLDGWAGSPLLLIKVAGTTAAGALIGLALRAAGTRVSALEDANRRHQASAARLATGDLSAGSEAEAFAKLVSRLRTTVQETQLGAAELGRTAGRILAGINTAVAEAQHEAAAVHQTTATASELQETVRVTEQRARDIQEVVARTVEATQAIRGQLDASAGSMDRMREQMHAIVGAVEALSKRNARIGEIVESIREVAGQTHLLAVNAGIESAKAGDVGRGFAVVATEMKALADQSRKAADHIRAIVADTQNAAAETTRVISDGQARLEDAMTPVAEVLPLVEQLIALVEESNGSLRQILAVVGQQVTGIEQIGQAMRTVSTAVQGGLQRNEQLAQGAEGLESLGRRLSAAVEGYRL